MAKYQSFHTAMSMERYFLLASLLLVCLAAIVKTDGTRNSVKKSQMSGESQLADQLHGCPEEFKGRCRCGNIAYDGINATTFVTNCTNTNFTDVTMLRSLPIQTEILIFTGNNVTSLPQNVFGLETHFNRLHTIDMSNNQIELVKGKTFHNVKNVTKLILNDNKFLITGNNFHPRVFSNFENLEELHLRNAFGDAKRDLNFMEDLVVIFAESDLKTLRILNLENNAIQAFPHPYVFCSMPVLQKLLLSENEIMDFQFNLTCNRDLRLVDLSNNFILNLDKTSIAYFDGASQRFHVNLTKNPFRCDCRMRDMYEWLNTTKVWIIGNKRFHCSSGFPKDNVGRLFSQISLLDLQCVTVRKNNIATYITASYVVLSTLIIVLCLVLIALIYSNRDNIARGWALISNALAAKREYTALDKQTKRNENQEVDEVAV